VVRIVVDDDRVAVPQPVIHQALVVRSNVKVEAVAKETPPQQDGSTGDDVPLGHAEQIARVFEANVTALYLNVLPEVLFALRRVANLAAG